MYADASSTCIISDPTDVTAGAPFAGVFTCSVSIGKFKRRRRLAIEWIRVNLDLPTKSFHSTKTTSHGVIISSLVIPNVTSEDIGSYYCSLRVNGIGVQSNKALLSFSKSSSICV